MLRTDENETEILLGNKQLLGIFLVVAILLGVSFTGGYLVGRGGAGKKPAVVETAALTNADPSLSALVPAGQSRTLDGEPTLPAAAAGGADAESVAPPLKSQLEAGEPGGKDQAPALGSRKRPVLATTGEETGASVRQAKTPEVETGYSPHAGSQYLQVAAVGQEEAENVADVLHKKGFHAHAVPKPGNAKLYRVIIGPVKDSGELSSTRDALRKTGFREVIVQRY